MIEEFDVNLHVLLRLGAFPGILALSTGAYLWGRTGDCALSYLFMGGGGGGLIVSIALALNLHLTRARAEAAPSHREAQVAEHGAAAQDKSAQTARAPVPEHQALATAGHDLRQPLSALNFFLEDLRRRLDKPEELQILDKIQESLDLIEHALTNLLDITRLESGRLQPELRVFTLDSLFSRLAEDFMPPAEDKGLLLEFPPPLPCHEMQVYSDPLLLRRIFEELLSNAVKFTAQGNITLACEAPATPPPALVAATQEQSAYLCVSVCDTGIGIPAEEHEAVFSEFYRLCNSQRDRHKGMGLGLALVKHAARLLGHPFTMESQPGHGTRFYLYLPLHSEGRGKSSTTASSQAVVDKEANEKEADEHANILFLEDDDRVRMIINEFLQGWGYHVIYADNIETALEKLTQENFVPHLILTDYSLCKHDTGVHAVSAIRAHFAKSDLPCIVMTGEVDREREREAAEHCCEILQKPAKPAHLRKLIRYYLRPMQGED